MKIKRIEIIGFKSFVDKTVLNFESGITAILGPNGCGKSNVIDAIRWAMGEQSAKNLRGQAMEDVIFGGSEKRRAHGMADVTMVFSNPTGVGTTELNQYSEIMVTRRLYRNGDSEYLLNKTPCRLKDIAELFMDTGVGARAYSIIEQGKIGMILQSRPEERRVLIEEAAGVTKYKARKKAALRKIEATRSNLTRLNDVIGEVRRQRDSLRRQASKAQRFRDLRNQAKELEIHLARSRWTQLEEETEQLAAQLKQAEQNQARLEAAVAESELQFEQARLEQVEVDDAASRMQNQLFQLSSDIQKVESQRELTQQQQQHLEQQQVSLQGQLQRSQRHRTNSGNAVGELDKQCGEVAEQIKQHSCQRDELRERVEQFVQQQALLNNELDSVRKQLIVCHAEISSIATKRAQAEQKIVSLQERKQRQISERLTVEERRQVAEQQLQQCSEDLELLQAEAIGDEQRKSVMIQQRDIAQQQRNAAEQRLQQLQQRSQQCRSRLESLQELDVNRVGYDDGVKAALVLPQLASVVHRLVTESLRVDATYEVAVAAVLGQRLQSIQLENPEVLDQLVANPSLSRCHFQLAVAGDAVLFPHGTAMIDLVEVDSQAQPFADAVFNGIYVVESLCPFWEQSLPRGCSLVTLTGEVLSWQGMVIIGQDGGPQRQLLENKRRIDELEQEKIDLEQQLAPAQALYQECSQQFEQLKQQLQQHALQEQRHQLKSETVAKDRSRALRELEQLQERLEAILVDTDQFTSEDVQFKAVVADLTRQADDVTSSRHELEQTLPDCEKRLADHQLFFRDQQNELSKLEVELARLLERQQTYILDLKREESAVVEQQQLQVDLQRRLNLCQSELKALLEGRSDGDARLQVLLERHQRELDVQSRSKERVQQVHDRVNDCEQVAKQRRGELGAASEQTTYLQMKVREHRLELEHLHQNLRDKYQIDLERQSAIDQNEIAHAAEKLHKLRVRLEAFGEVNLMAIDEFTALEERFTFLEQQRDDVRNSIDDLQAAITRINRTTRKRFKEAFEQINDQFKKVFPRLFVGGEAELRLTDEADLLESGIDIIAQPPGKKLQNVGLLSGGEKALTAVALIFAIFLIKPSPFCILDEVDAPLDDANIGRFNEMVKEMSTESQFVIITHNTRTMEIADTLFGVTMEEPGISSLVAVRMDDLSTPR